MSHVQAEGCYYFHVILVNVRAKWIESLYRVAEVPDTDLGKVFGCTEDLVVFFSPPPFFFIYSLNQQSEFTFYELML
jgi:hypothetical protein